MPRVTGKRIDSKEFQGEGSFVVLRPLPWKAAKEARKFIAVGNVSSRTDISDEEKEQRIEAESNFTEDMIFRSVVEWNWTDDNGAPLPVPRKQEDLELLTMDEVSFLVESIIGLSDSKAKN